MTLYTADRCIACEEPMRGPARRERRAALALVGRDVDACPCCSQVAPVAACEAAWRACERGAAK